MKKKFLRTIAICLIVATSMFTLTACSKRVVKVSVMMDIFNEIGTGNADIGILDAVLVEHIMSLSSPLTNGISIIHNINFPPEHYGIGMRKGENALADKLNTALAELSKNGKIAEIANKYALIGRIEDTSNYVSPTEEIEDKSSFNYIKSRGKFVVGYTLLKPLAFKTEDSKKELTGFDIDLAKAVAEMWGVTAEFKEIDWSQKELELSSSSIDFIWNGFTINDKRKEQMTFSVPYMINSQFAICKKASIDKYATVDLIKEELKNKKRKDRPIFAAEAGSAGATVIKDVFGVKFK